MRILTHDPSMTAWGWAVIEFVNGKPVITDSGCIKTEPEYKKRRIRKSDDTSRRLERICQELLQVHDAHDIQWIVSEAPHGSQSASAAQMIGAVAGLLVGMAKTLGLPLEWYSEGDAKKNLLGKRSGSKKDIQDCIIDIYGDTWYQDIKYKDEAVADALAVFHVAQATSPGLKHFSQSSKQTLKRTR